MKLPIFNTILLVRQQRFLIKSLFLIVAIIMVLLFHPASVSAASPIIWGHVNTTTGSPVSGVWIEWRDGHGNTRYSQTDGNGFYWHFSSQEITYMPNGPAPFPVTPQPYWIAHWDEDGEVRSATHPVSRYQPLHSVSSTDYNPGTDVCESYIDHDRDSSTPNAKESNVCLGDGFSCTQNPHSYRVVPKPGETGTYTISYSDNVTMLNNGSGQPRLDFLYTAPPLTPTPTLPPSAPPTCVVSGPRTACTGSPATYTVVGSDSDLRIVYLYRSPTAAPGWQELCTASGGVNSCTSSSAFSSAGTYYVVCNATDNANHWCSGNPFSLPGGWTDCGLPGSRMTVTVTDAPAAVGCASLACHTNTVTSPNGSCGGSFTCYSNAPPKRNCPTYCGYAGGDVYSNGDCTTTTCPARPACGIPNPPTISPLTCSPTSTYSVDISWTSPNVNYVDISKATNNMDNDYSTKAVSGSPTTAPDGFWRYAGTGLGGQLYAGEWYWARVTDINGMASSWKFFMREASLPPESCPTYCHTSPLWVSNGACDYDRCQPIIFPRQNDLACTTTSVTLQNGDCTTRTQPPNNPAWQADLACTTTAVSRSNGNCTTRTQSPNCWTSCSGNVCLSITPPTVSPLTCSPTSTYSVDINWTAPNVAYVDISSTTNNQDNNFSTHEVSGVNSISAPAGFWTYQGTGVSTFFTGEWYWARIFDIHANTSGWKFFKRDACPSCNAVNLLNANGLSGLISGIAPTISQTNWAYSDVLAGTVDGNTSCTVTVTGCGATVSNVHPFPDNNRLCYVTADPNTSNYRARADFTPTLASACTVTFTLAPGGNQCPGTSLPSCSRANGVCNAWVWSCSGANRVANRTYTAPTCGGIDVTCAPLTQTISCNDNNSCTTDSCSAGACVNTNVPINGGWTWTDLNLVCVLSCGPEYQTRTCTLPAPSCGGNECQRTLTNNSFTQSSNLLPNFDNSETVSCNHPDCVNWLKTQGGDVHSNLQLQP